jgi:hypothetical protein
MFTAEPKERRKKRRVGEFHVRTRRRFWARRPGPYVFASTTGRAVSPRWMGESNPSVRCLGTLDTERE